MKKTHITYATVAALTAAIALAPVAKADVQSKLNEVKGITIVTPSEKLNAVLAKAAGEKANAEAGQQRNEVLLETAKVALKAAQEAQADGIEAIDAATKAALKVAEAPVTEQKEVIANTEKEIAKKEQAYADAQAKLRELNTVAGITGKEAELAQLKANILKIESELATLKNTTLPDAKKELAKREETLVEWKEERAKQDAKDKKNLADATARAQSDVTKYETEVTEWKAVVKALDAEVEAAKIALVKNGLSNEVIAQIIADAQAQVKDTAVTATPVYRLYNPGLKVHLYTTDTNEYAVLGQSGWNQEGLAFKSAKEGTPVYRLYNADLKVHLYTTDANEYAVLGARGWNQEGVAFYSAKEGAPVYRLYNATLKKHLYTTDLNEYNALATRGWNQEGVAFYSAK